MANSRESILYWNAMAVGPTFEQACDMDRLSSLDASFLRAETANAHMHVGWLSLTRPREGSRGINPDLVRLRISQRLDLTPRFRQRVVDVPVGNPPLIDDPSFSIERHVRVLPCPEGGMDIETLQSTLDSFLSTQLNRAKPLWEIAIVPELEDGRGAIMGKVHHALVDGVAAVELGMLLFDVEPDPTSAEPVMDPDEWRPRMPPSPATTMLSSAADSAVEQFRTAGRMASMGLQPTRGIRVADSMRKAAFQMAREIMEPAPESYLNGPIGPTRTLRTTSLPLERVLDLKQKTGSKLNDIVLAITSGALRDFSEHRRNDPGPLRAMIPINVRGGDSSTPSAEGNRIGFGFLELPIGSGDPMTRLRSVKRQGRALRDEGRVAGSDTLMQGVGMLPGPLRGAAERLASSSRTFNLTISNVPGPRIGLYAAGCEVESIYPVIPLAGSHALAIGVLTYSDGLHIALHAEPERLPDAADLPELFKRSLAELEQAAQRTDLSGIPRGPRRREEGEHIRPKVPSRRRAGSIPPAG